jgi:hypothetical protein
MQEISARQPSAGDGPVADEAYLWLITTRFHPPLIAFYIARIAMALL